MLKPINVASGWRSRLVLAGLALSFAFSTLGLFANANPWLEMFNHIRPITALATAALFVLACSCGRQFVAPAAAALVWSGFPIFMAAGFAADTGSAGRAQIKIVSVNTWRAEPDNMRLLSYLRNQNADLIFLQEVGAAERDLVRSELRNNFPYSALDLASALTPLILSRTPLSNEHVERDAAGEVFAVWARTRIVGREIAVASVHLANPLQPEQQARQVELLAERVRACNTPLVIGGDFNLTPFSLGLQSIARAGQLSWLQTFTASWPARPLPFLLLDHILVTPDLARADSSIGPDIGSDHLPVIGVIHIVDGPITSNGAALQLVPSSS